MWVLLLLAACSDTRVLPTAREAVPLPAPLQAMAFSALVDTRAGTVRVSAPPSGATSGRAVGATRDAGPVALSLLGADAVRITTANVHRSRVGAYAPGQVRITFDVTIESALPTLALAPASWPAPPTASVVLFPVEASVPPLASDGGSAVTVTLPAAGAVTVSPEWNGTGAPGSGGPWDVLGGQPCPAVAPPRCVRWVAFGVPSSAARGPFTRTVGFDVGAAVTQFAVRLVLAADLVPAPGP